VLSEVERWLGLRPAGSGRLEVDPRELAQLLGRLVFASQVIPGGRTFMMAMLRSFGGLVVDWRRGAVRPRAGAWRAMWVEGGFWRDLEWLRDHVSVRNCVPLQPRAAAEAVVAGTDASGWGAGELVWLDGAREETQLRFTEAEQRRPINWRELLGILRVCEVWGARMAGRVVLVETDNLAACATAKKKQARAEDMQELIRRLLVLCERHDITLRLTHTPGAKLHRPDQTSRGDPVEEPRQRLPREAYAGLAARYGPYSAHVGAERLWAPLMTEWDGRHRWWLHPTHTTVGTALRMVVERARELPLGHFTATVERGGAR
jgi:hypothetical protein